MSHWGPILAATDFSAPAQHAAERAARLAHETGSPLTLMHVLSGSALQDLQQWLGAGHAMELQLQADVRQQLRQLADDLQTARHADVRTVDRNGVTLDEIIREADALEAALLVVGARGAGFLRRLVVGTTSERLLRRTTRPVLMVRQTPHERYRRVLVALDFSPWSQPAVSVARCVAPHAQFVLVHAFQVPFEEKLHFAGVAAAHIDHYREHARAEAVQRMHVLAQDAGLGSANWAPCIVDGDASHRILEMEHEHDCDLVVLGKHGHSATEDLLLGSVTHHVLAEGSADVLVSTARASSGIDRDPDLGDTYDAARPTHQDAR